MTAVQLVALFFAGLGVASVIIALAYWLFENGPKGSKQFRSVRVGSYFTRSDSESSGTIVSQKTGKRYYTPLSGRDKHDKLRASGDMPCFNVELPVE